MSGFACVCSEASACSFSESDIFKARLNDLKKLITSPGICFEENLNNHLTRMLLGIPCIHAPHVTDKVFVHCKLVTGSKEG